MTHRYSPAEREEAALICAIAASGEATRPYVLIHKDLTGEIAEWGGAPHVELAAKAWDCARRTYDFVWTREVDAEAEALLRSGWLPREVP